MLSKIKEISSLRWIMENLNYSATVRSDVRQMGDTLCIFIDILSFGHPFWDALIDKMHLAYMSIWRHAHKVTFLAKSTNATTTGKYENIKRNKKCENEV